MKLPVELIRELSDFPHIQNRVGVQWGSKECREYLHSLTVTDRPNRKGFPFNAILAIDSLIQQHDEDFPKYIPKRSVWDDV